jgi:hypothetical protein
MLGPDIEPAEGEGERCDAGVRDISCEGVGLDLPEGANIRPGTVVTVRLALPDGPVELSARVVWTAGKRAGLRLRLAESEATDKKAFGAWIAPRTKQALHEP